MSKCYPSGIKQQVFCCLSLLRAFPLSNHFAKHLFYGLKILCSFSLIFQFNCGFAIAYHGRNIPVNVPTFNKPTDPNSTSVSPAALQMAGFLGIENELRSLEQLRKQIAKTEGVKSNLELRQDFTELKLDMIAAVEHVRLDVDFVVAELEDEHARHSELYQACNDEALRRINRANINAFRTNGVLWAVAESLSIPTYKQPKYSIPSGAVGIIAGIVPSIFSLYAMRTPKEYYSTSGYPNMLSKFFDYPTTPRTEYPNSVWAFINAKPIGESAKTRREIMIGHWLNDRNIHCFKNGKTKDSLDLVTGTKKELITPELLADQLLMLHEVKALVLAMNRPLMELIMIVRGQKEF